LIANSVLAKTMKYTYMFQDKIETSSIIMQKFLDNKAKSWNISTHS